MNPQPLDERPQQVRHSDVPPRGETAAPVPADVIGVNLRVLAIARMVKMNIAHARQAWQLRRRDPLSPYALAFLYITPATPPWYQLAASTRVWFAEPETTHLPDLLHDLNKHIHQVLQKGQPFDPRTQLANEPETADPMPHNASYYGVGLSSLDTDTGSWARVCQRAAGEEYVPGEITVAATDGTVMVCRRRDRTEYGQCQVFSNQPIEVADGRAPWPNKVSTLEQVLADDSKELVQARLFLLGLHSTLYEAEFHRMNRSANGVSATQDGRRVR